MRLLRCDDNDGFSLVNCDEDEIPPYAILSHTWGADYEEVAFKDLLEGTGKEKAGYRKLTFCRKQALNDRLQYAWVDTCCIDKSNSVELSEAINSMFRWYQKAARCYVFLSDISLDGPVLSSQWVWRAAFQNSKWFTRGWTLQELLAPTIVEFFSVEGERIGDRNSLVNEIHNITGIDIKALQGSPLSQFSVKDRMLWAQDRRTKRPEDAAYSLLGIFDIHMSLIYGEGRVKAFRRLEREIKENTQAATSEVEPWTSAADILRPHSRIDRDPLSVLDRAGEFVTFVQNSNNIVKRVVELHRSASGELVQLEELFVLAHQLKQSTWRLFEKSSSIHPQFSENLTSLCNTFPDQLIAVLNDFDARMGKSESKTSFQAVVPDSVVRELVEGMGRFRDTLHSHLLTVLDPRESKSVTVLRNLEKQQETLNAHDQPVQSSDLKAIVPSIESFRRDIRHQISMEAERPRKRARHHSEVTSVKVDEDEGEERLLALPQDMQIWSSTLSESAQAAKFTRAWFRILLSLRFPDMRIRESNINEAHKNTYDWVLDPAQDDTGKRHQSLPLINSWLRYGDGVFWLAGKAGSGKSTLMKHVIRQASKLESLVRVWATRKKVVTASFFFWNSGSKLQKSQEGLLRTLIYQVFHACPELIPKLCPEEWQEALYYEIYFRWTLTDLLKILRRFFALEISTRSFCFFIDGLDEFDGDPLDLIQTLQSLNKNPSIKICLSSRPWNAFEEAFGKDKTRCLRLEEHNRKDILCFVRDTISKSPGYLHLLREGAECNSLINEIVEKANGVFLWVFLVVRSLMRGLVHGDSIHGLRVRLRKFPPELEAYFMHMFKSIEEIYLQETAELLQVSVAAREPHPALLYQVLLAPNIDACGESLRRVMETSDIDAFHDGLQMTKKRINARCQDLLETTEPEHIIGTSPNPFMEVYHGTKVDFLHRTVSDFLRGPEMTTILSKHVSKDFEPRARIDQGFKIIFQSFEYLNRD